MPKGYTIVVENIFKNEDEEIRKQDQEKLIYTMFFVLFYIY